MNNSDNYCRVIGEIANNTQVINSFQENQLDLAPFYLSRNNEIILIAIIESSRGYELMSVYQKFQGDIWDARFSHPHFFDIISYLLDSVSGLHRSGYYHLDIKLSNILYDDTVLGDTRYSLCDFGSLANIECDNTHRGTRPYMSPLTDFNKQEFKNHYLKLIKKPVTHDYFTSFKNIRQIQMHVVIPCFESITEDAELDMSEIYHPDIIQIMNSAFETYPTILTNYLSCSCNGLKSAATEIQKLILQKTDLHAIGISLLALAEKNSLNIENNMYRWITRLISGDITPDYYSAESARNDFEKII